MNTRLIGELIRRARTRNGKFALFGAAYFLLALALFGAGVLPAWTRAPFSLLPAAGFGLGFLFRRTALADSLEERAG